MRVHFAGGGHLAETMARAAELRGFELSGLPQADLAFVAVDVLDHSKFAEVDVLVWEVLRGAVGAEAVVILSQVPPGYTRRVWDRHRLTKLYYQVDTIIVCEAVARAMAPEQFVVGCADPAADLPLAYQHYLAAFRCPVLQMSYESAELTKCAINYFLCAQIKTTNELAAAAEKLGASWGDVAAALKNDARVGPRAYLRPGEPNRHLLRDHETLQRVLGGHGFDFKDL